jgi:hypothetical protein
MRKLLSIFALLMAASMLVWFAGCGDDDDDDDAGPAPSVTSVSISEGQEVAGNTSITITFSKAVQKATVTVSGATGAVSGVPGNTITWTPSPDMPVGAHTLTVTAEDAGGQGLDPAFTPVNFKAIVPDTTPPALDGGACDPKDGADGVDPADIAEVLTVKFSEALAEAKITKKEPEFNSTDELVGDTLTVSPLKFSFPNETEVIIGISATDAAGNTAELEYGFTTMAKEQ